MTHGGTDPVKECGPAVRSIVSCTLALAVLALAGAPSYAQQGIALGGGGARGLAHAGVLVALDELGYEPEIVTGTSMGAIVGALYAAGYSPAEIWREIVATDWPGLFTALPHLQGPTREPRYPMFEFGGGSGIRRRGIGLVTEWRVNRLLTRYLFDAGVRARGDFDRLPRRYRAVAADVESGEAVALGSGNLARAVRASMAVPGAFSAVAWGDRLLVDGGVADYLPVLPAREMGARHVVAVDVIRPPSTLTATDPLALLIRSFRLILRNALPAGAEPDVLLVPPIPTNVFEFAFSIDPTILLEVGLAAGLTAPPPPVTGRGASPPAAPPARWRALVVESPDPALTPFVRQAFRDVAPGPYDPGAVFRAADRLYATGLVDGVWPDADPAAPRDTAPALIVLVDPAPATAVAAAAGYDTDRQGRLWLSARGRAAGPLTLELAGSLNAIERWVTLGYTLPSVRLLPLRWTGGAFARSVEIPRLPDREGSPPGVQRYGGWLGMELRGVGPDRYLSVGASAEWIREDAGEARFAAGPDLRIGLAPVASPIVGGPTEVEASFRFGGEGDYGRARVRGSLHARRGWLLAAAGVDAAVASGDAPLDVLPALGDGWAMPGLRWGELRSRAYFLAGGDVAYPVFPVTRVRLRVRAAATDREVGVAGDGSRFLAGAEIAAVWRTLLGGVTITAAFGANTRGHRVFRIDLGGSS